ncbi:hypothetical protein CJP55_04035 [Lactobacillus plantarum]|nr:hypothetical protein [Lactiplantibacillus plantarum]
MNDRKQLQSDIAQIAVNLDTSVKNKRVVGIFDDYSTFGKALVSINLGLHWSNLGDKTLIINLDQSDNIINRTFKINLKNIKGIDTILFDDNYQNVDKCLFSISNTLYYLPVSNVRSLIDMENIIIKLKILLDNVVDSYKKVIVNMPVLGLSDYEFVQLSGVIDAGILVQSLRASKYKNLHAYFKYSKLNCYLGLVYLRGNND